MFRDIENRYHGLKKALRQLFDLSFSGRERNQNSLYSYILAKSSQNEPDSLIRVNAGVYSYDLAERPDEYARFLERLHLFWMSICLMAGVKTCGRSAISQRSMTAAH